MLVECKIAKDILEMMKELFCEPIPITPSIITSNCR